MRRIVNKESIESLAEPSKMKEPDFSLVSTTLDELSAKAQEILRREITNLMIESTKGLLSRDNAMSLTSYIKLLGELKAKEDEELRNLSDEHLEKIVNGNKP
jgi:hypothetical protein